MKRLLTSLLMVAPAAYCGDVSIVDVRVECPSTCTFAVTLEHADEGWDHYADRWEVMTLDGRLLGTRVLYHPHENEQPFTRSQSGISIPPGIQRVKVRARDSRHGYSEQEYIVTLPGG